MATSCSYEGQRCIRKHVGLSFGFQRSASLPNPPSEHQMRDALWQIEHGQVLPKPYRFDWRSPPTTLYNMCVENAFSADFWASARGGQYDVNLIPKEYQERGPFIEAYRRYITYLKKCWASQQEPPPEEEQVAKARHYSRNSRVGTVNRFSFEFTVCIDGAIDIPKPARCVPIPPDTGFFTCLRCCDSNWHSRNKLG